ncbi:MAG: ABC transporter permease [Nitrospinaceae bacterium]
MNYGRIRAMTRKEFIHVIRDPRSIIMGVVIPVILLLLFAYALTLDVDNVPIMVWDQSESPASREFISRFKASRYFQIKGHTENYRDLERAIDMGTILAGLILPRDFAQRLESRRPVQVQWIVDGSDANTATIATGYATAVTLAYSEEVVLRDIRKVMGKILERPVDVRPRVWFNADMESKNFIIPGLIAVIMMVIAALLTSLTVAREWERGTMEQLISTPLTGPELILGKLAPYFAIGIFDVLLAVLMGEFLFHVPLRGSVWLLFGLASVFLVGASSMGMLISILTKNQLLANQLALLTTFIPAFLLSGFAFPINNMPVVVQWITHLVPAMYLVHLLKGVYLKGVGLEVMFLEAGLLTLFAVVMIGLAVIKFKKKLG